MLFLMIDICEQPPMVVLLFFVLPHAFPLFPAVSPLLPKLFSASVIKDPPTAAPRRWCELSRQILDECSSVEEVLKLLESVEARSREKTIEKPTISKHE